MERSFLIQFWRGTVTVKEGKEIHQFASIEEACDYLKLSYIAWDVEDDPAPQMFEDEVPR